jgi:hypothetical protein
MAEHARAGCVTPSSLQPGQIDCHRKREYLHAGAGYTGPADVRSRQVHTGPGGGHPPGCAPRHTLTWQLPVEFTFDAELWLWDARRADSWTFVSLPAGASADIQDFVGATPRRGFGSVRVRVTIGGSAWSTSIFPDASSGSYVLPIKKSVRKTEALEAGDTATVTIELVDV